MNLVLKSMLPLFSISILNDAGAQNTQVKSGVKWNIFLIMADDMGWKDLGCMGSNYYETPFIDQSAIILKL
jgi:hypothetical protein